jgi:hypothetical protein
MRRAVRAAAVLTVCAGLVVAPEVRAAGDSDTNAAAAEASFQEGRKLMEAKRYAEACPKFAASQKSAPAIGTLLNLADCYEKNNQLASAWTKFHEAIALAQRLGRSNREQTARERADKLESRIIKLSILAHASGLDVKLDGNPVDPAVLGTPIPVDAGKHTLEATAKGKKPFAKDFEVSYAKKNPSIDIPPLEDEGKDPKETKDPKDNESKDDKEKTPEPKKERRGWSTQKTIGIVAAGAGVVALGVGTFLGLRTRSTWNDAQNNHCNGTACDQDGVDLAAQAKSSGNLATIFFIAGAVLGGGGAVLFLTGGSAKATASGAGGARVGVGPGSVVLGGSF